MSGDDKRSGRVEAITVLPQEDELRLDRWFRIHFPAVGYGYLQKLLRSGQVRVNGKRVEANARVSRGDEVRVPKVAREAPKPDAATAAEPKPHVTNVDRALIENAILFEDEHVLVLDKPYGLAVQGGSGTKRHIDGMLAAMSDRFGERPRLVHRLDRDTLAGDQGLSAQWASARPGAGMPCHGVRAVHSRPVGAGGYFASDPDLLDGSGDRAEAGVHPAV